MPDVFIYLFIYLFIIMNLFSGAASVTKNSKPAAVVCVSCYLRVFRCNCKVSTKSCLG